MLDSLASELLTLGWTPSFLALWLTWAITWLVCVCSGSKNESAFMISAAALNLLPLVLQDRKSAGKRGFREIGAEESLM